MFYWFFLIIYNSFQICLSIQHLFWYICCSYNHPQITWLLCIAYHILQIMSKNSKNVLLKNVEYLFALSCVTQEIGGVKWLSRHKRFFFIVRPAGRYLILFHDSLDTAYFLLWVVIKVTTTLSLTPSPIINYRRFLLWNQIALTLHRRLWKNWKPCTVS